jgi:hypothetical protein
MAEDAPHRESRLLDLRFVIALMFLIFGVLVTLAGVFADQESIDKAAGINISLWTGLGMLVLSGVFFLWLAKAPVEVAHSRSEVHQQHLDEAWGEGDVPPVRE